jgi:hypothetical protein
VTHRRRPAPEPHDCGGMAAEITVVALRTAGLHEEATRLSRAVAQQHFGSALAETTIAKSVFGCCGAARLAAQLAGQGT